MSNYQKIKIFIDVDQVVIFVLFFYIVCIGSSHHNFFQCYIYYAFFCSEVSSNKGCAIFVQNLSAYTTTYR